VSILEEEEDGNQELVRNCFDCDLVKPIRRSELLKVLTVESVELSKHRVLREEKGQTDLVDVKVLVAEDNPVNREVTLNMLVALGCNAMVVENGEEAVRAVTDNDFDIVLMDCQMPVMDGYVSTEQIRKYEDSEGIQDRVPIVALTANAMLGDEQNCLAAGMDGYLSKPFKQSKLEAVLGRWCRKIKVSDRSAHDITEDETEECVAHSDSETSVDATDSGLDQSALQQIRDLNQSSGINVLEKVIDIYLNDGPTLLKRIELAVDNGDCSGLSMAAHALKSSSANLGAIGFAKLCARLEEMGRDEKIEGAELVLEQALPLFSRVQTDLALEKERAA
jgi:CheY-like chemotaxis protein